MYDKSDHSLTKSVSGESAPSTVDLFSGKHTTSIIVAILFIAVLIAFAVYLIWGKPYENTIITGFFSVLSLLGGFFAGTQVGR